jgi:hypothetical protein
VADDRARPFKERAYKNYQDEMADLKSVEAQTQEKERDEVEAYREPLSVEVRKEITVLLSWGGPSDGFRIYSHQDGEASEGYYFFADWFEYEEFKLSDKELEIVLAVYSDLSLVL